MDTISPTATTPVSTVPLTASPLPQPSQPLNVQTVQTQSIIYASFGRRFLAGLLDGVIVQIINIVIGWVPLFLFMIIVDKFGKNLGNRSISIVSPMVLYGAFIWLTTIIIFCGYFVYFIGSRGQTPGKMVVGIKVVKIDTHTSPGYISAFLREIVGKIISCLVICLGFFWMLWDKNKQTWHDKIANTIVIKI
ncbi:RDD family protein [Candidatus Gottesmanbacteria bacterium]|nr:RDD family protein [Candidatus Gottesmanbacteria bacterium]